MFHFQLKILRLDSKCFSHEEIVCAEDTIHCCSAKAKCMRWQTHTHMGEWHQYITQSCPTKKCWSRFNLQFPRTPPHSAHGESTQNQWLLETPHLCLRMCSHLFGCWKMNPSDVAVLAQSIWWRVKGGMHNSVLHSSVMLQISLQSTNISSSKCGSLSVWSFDLFLSFWGVTFVFLILKSYIWDWL